MLDSNGNMGQRHKDFRSIHFSPRHRNGHNALFTDMTFSDKKEKYSYIQQAYCLIQSKPHTTRKKKIMQIKYNVLSNS